MTKVRSRLPIVPLVCTALAAFALVGSACNARLVDVGAHDADSVPSASSVADGGVARSAYGCAEWIDDELYALREGGCSGFCGNTGVDDAPYPLDSKRDVMAATAGEWLFCEGSLGPEGAIGVEFAPGCRLYFLRRDGDGIVVRGTERSYQAAYDIHHPRPANAPARIDVHIDDERTLTFEVVANRCPERLRLADPGRAWIDMARPTDNPDNPGNPTR